MKQISTAYEINLWRMHPEEGDVPPKRIELDEERQTSEEHLKATYWG